jgi:predicted RNA-binding Zn-ribbon protein involved in translation (DUF1610 family)
MLQSSQIIDRSGVPLYDALAREPDRDVDMARDSTEGAGPPERSSRRRSPVALSVGRAHGDRAAMRLCSNLNHRRSDAPVRFCPSCGEIVNGKVSIARCGSARHDAQRRGQSIFCVDCGERLIKRVA